MYPQLTPSSAARMRKHRRSSRTSDRSIPLPTIQESNVSTSVLPIGLPKLEHIGKPASFFRLVLCEAFPSHVNFLSHTASDSSNHSANDLPNPSHRMPSIPAGFQPHTQPNPASNVGGWVSSSGKPMPPRPFLAAMKAKQANSSGSMGSMGSTGSSGASSSPTLSAAALDSPKMSSPKTPSPKLLTRNMASGSLPIITQSMISPTTSPTMTSSYPPQIPNPPVSFFSPPASSSSSSNSPTHPKPIPPRLLKRDDPDQKSASPTQSPVLERPRPLFSANQNFSKAMISLQMVPPTQTSSGSSLSSSGQAGRRGSRRFSFQGTALPDTVRRWKNLLPSEQRRRKLAIPDTIELSIILQGLAMVLNFMFLYWSPFGAGVSKLVGAPGLENPNSFNGFPPYFLGKYYTPLLSVFIFLNTIGSLVSLFHIQFLVWLLGPRLYKLCDEVWYFVVSSLVMPISSVLLSSMLCRDNSEHTGKIHEIDHSLECWGSGHIALVICSLLSVSTLIYYSLFKRVEFFSILERAKTSNANFFYESNPWGFMTRFLIQAIFCANSLFIVSVHEKIAKVVYFVCAFLNFIFMNTNMSYENPRCHGIAGSLAACVVIPQVISFTDGVHIGVLFATTIITSLFAYVLCVARAIYTKYSFLHRLVDENPTIIRRDYDTRVGKELLSSFKDGQYNPTDHVILLSSKLYGCHYVFIEHWCCVIGRPHSFFHTEWISKVVVIDLSRNSLTSSHVYHLSRALLTHESKVQKLCLSYNQLCVLSSFPLSCLIYHHIHLKELILDFNPSITLAGFRYIVNSIISSPNKNLVHLSVNFCNLGSDCAIPISKLLCSQTHRLSRLSVQGNELGVKGAEIISDAITLNGGRDISLQLEWNNMKKQGVEMLLNSIQIDSGNHRDRTKPVEGPQLGVLRNGLSKADFANIPKKGPDDVVEFEADSDEVRPFEDEPTQHPAQTQEPTERPEQIEPDSILTEIGGSEVMEGVIQVFCLRILNDPILFRFFERVNMVTLRAHLSHFFCTTLGDLERSMRVNIRRVHAHLRISDDHYDIYVELLIASILEMKPGLTPKSLRKITKILESFRSEIVKREEDVTRSSRRKWWSYFSNPFSRSSYTENANQPPV